MNKTHFFEKLVRAYTSDMYRYAFWLSKDKTVSEDLVQEAFTRAWKSIDNLKDEKAAKSWLMTIVRRENARRFEQIQPTLLEINDDLLIDEHTRQPTEEVDQQLLYKAMLKLPLDFREPLILQVIWGYSGEEIASQLDLKLATVNTRLFRAKKRLKIIYLGGESLEQDPHSYRVKIK